MFMNSVLHCAALKFSLSVISFVCASQDSATHRRSGKARVCRSRRQRITSKLPSPQWRENYAFGSSRRRCQTLSRARSQACNSKGSIMSKASDRYVKVVAWSEEDQCYVGRCPGLMLGGVHGSDERAVYAELCEAVDEWIRLHEAEGRPLPRSTSLREIEALV